ncbi:MAG: nitroreductase family protein [Pirellulales bacterium]
MSHPPLAAELAAVIQNRRSIRKYAPELISPAQILEIVALAGRAPSAWNLQPWRFVAVVDPKTKSALQQVAYGQPQVASAPVVIVLYSDMIEALERVDDALPHDATSDQRDKIRADITGYFGKLTAEQRDAWGRCQTYIALGYLLLILESRGYGSSPMLGFDPAGVKQLLDLPNHAEVAALVAFGKPAHSGRQSTRHNVKSLMRMV